MTRTTAPWLRRARAITFVAATIALAGVVGAAPPAAQAHSQQFEWVCVSSHHAPDDGLSLLLPMRAVDWLVEQTYSYRGPCAEYGERAPLGTGELTAYSQRIGSRPVSVGLRMSEGALDELPTHPPSDGKWCFDKNSDGTTDPMSECTGGYESQLDLGAGFGDQVDSPYTYVLANWNPHGHIPLGVYDVPHFDVHFYVNEDAERTAIRPGPCPQLVNCDDYVLGKRLPEDRYLAPDYDDVDAVEPAMGNHLIDLTGPEFQGQPFTHAWVYGTWNAEVTFYEAMVTHEWLDGLRSGSVEDACHDFKLPEAWAESGWYATSYCMRYHPVRREVTVSLENFVYRTGS
jgi:hypothetical protein